MKELIVSVYYNTSAQRDVDIEQVRFMCETKEQATSMIEHIISKYDDVLERQGDSFVKLKFIQVVIEDGAGLL